MDDVFTKVHNPVQTEHTNSHIWPWLYFLVHQYHLVSMLIIIKNNLTPGQTVIKLIQFHYNGICSVTRNSQRDNECNDG